MLVFCYARGKGLSFTVGGSLSLDESAVAISAIAYIYYNHKNSNHHNKKK